PATSPNVPLNNRTIINSDEILQIPELPKTLIVVGGGVIGVEYTCMFAVLGVRVILVEKRRRLLEFADEEIVETLSYHLRDRRVIMRLNEEVQSVEETPDGKVVANLQSNKKVFGDALLYAVGRVGNVEELNVTAAGITPDSRGRITVDSEFRTSQPHIFAVGDVIGFPSLASVSMEPEEIFATAKSGDQRSNCRSAHTDGWALMKPDVDVIHSDTIRRRSFVGAPLYERRNPPVADRRTGSGA
ncbi:MAG TPA: FAD-dependent oxidoreductase, partial [Candidatus Dormibacteraeota bacterium]|nr:FAD-dependent oxidoreductase [Candidatus Dormibacteraeota bacterium]